ncbi:hypothetical protein [Halalkalicoccus ordinarius]|uniref:hypothetical protein n=1 Tax=Halalkalicoccus ordinarius TaxID=3116651 RepID=UPI00300EEF79
MDAEVAREAGFDPVSAFVTTIARVPYYSGWSRMVVHATADVDTGRLIGQRRRRPITAGMTAREVGSLDFGYAPPFGPVWDPVLGVAKVLDEKPT